jgi:hypothetical protein
MGAQHRERVTVGGVTQRVDVGFVQHGGAQVMTLGASRPVCARMCASSSAMRSAARARPASRSRAARDRLEALEVQAQRRAHGAGADSRSTMRAPSSNTMRTPCRSAREPSTGSV